MQTRACLRYVRVSPLKARLVADQVRGKNVRQALDILKFATQKSAALIRKLLDSAIANAENNNGVDIDELVVDGIQVDEGPRLKRMQPRAKGRGNRILKRTSHITITVSNEKVKRA